MAIGVRDKIILITAVTIFLAIGVNTMVISRMFRKEYSASLLSKMEVVANTLRSQVESLLSLGISIDNIEGFETQCQEVLYKHDDVACAMVVQSNGNILFRGGNSHHEMIMDDPEILKGIDKGHQTTCLTKIHGPKYYHTIVPIGGIETGPNTAIVIGFPAAIIDRKIENLRFYSIMVLFISLGIATFVLITSLSVSVTKPLSGLVSTIQQIRESSNLERKVTVRSRDEIGKLAINFNKMIEDLNRTTVSRDSLMAEVTERKKAEQELTKLLSLHTATLEATADGILVIGLNGRIVAFNRKFLQLWRIPDDIVETGDDNKLLSCVLEQLIDPQGFLSKVQWLYAHPQEQSSDMIEFKDGRIFDRFSQPQKVGDKIVGRVWGFRDITERKKADEALRTKEAQLSNAMKIANLGYWEYDVADNLFTFNDRFYDIYRTTAEQVDGYQMKPSEYAERFVHPDDRQLVEIETRKAIETTDPKYNRQIEHRIIYADGQMGYICVRFSIVKDEQGRTVKTFGANQDITERKKAEEELEKTHEQLLETSRIAGMAEVATNVLHNVGNVLNSINVSANYIESKIGNSKVGNLKKVTDMIREHIDNLETFFVEDERGRHIPEYLAEAVGLIVDEQADVAAKIKSLMRNVEHIKQIIQSQQRYAKTYGVEVFVDINEVIKHAIEISNFDSKRKGVECELEFTELPQVRLDKQRVLQILVNLINNARQALAESGTPDKLLRIRCYKHCEDKLRIEVADNGIGISGENMSRIFRHGFTTREGGHGYGLHSSALAAREMGGSLTVNSDGPEKGTTFTLELPFKSLGVVECVT